MAILITGATGFIGKHVVTTLTNLGYKLICPVRNHISFVPLKSELIKLVAYENLREIKKLIKQEASLVIHLATSYGRTAEQVSEVLQVNYEYPMQLVEACSLKKIPFINTDTFFNNESPQKYLQEYALSKKLFLNDAKSLIGTNGKFISLKLEHVYGPYDGNQKFVTWLIRDMLHDKEQIHLTDCEQKRDFIFVDDVVSAYVKVIESCESFPVGNSEVGVGTGLSIPLKYFVETCRRLTNTKSHIVFGAKSRNQDEILNSYANIDKLIELGWRQKVTLDLGVMRTIEYIRSTI